MRASDVNYQLSVFPSVGVRDLGSDPQAAHAGLEGAPSSVFVLRTGRRSEEAHTRAAPKFASA
jgi:hypothetical protein